MLYMLLYAVRAMAATRTQIYLTAEQRKRLDELRKREGKSLAELIRAAVDRYLEDESPPKVDLQAHLDRFFGIAPDLERFDRSEWGRDFGRNE
jgi:transcriptional regulator with XRE-family HTH domain